MAAALPHYAYKDEYGGEIENIVDYEFATDTEPYEDTMKRIQRIRRGSTWNSEYMQGNNSILPNAIVTESQPSVAMNTFSENIARYKLTEMLDPDPSKRRMSSEAT